MFPSQNGNSGVYYVLWRSYDVTKLAGDIYSDFLILQTTLATRDYAKRLAPCTIGIMMDFWTELGGPSTQLSVVGKESPSELWRRTQSFPILTREDA